MGGYTCFTGFAPRVLRLWPSGGALFVHYFLDMVTWSKEAEDQKS